MPRASLSNARDTLIQASRNAIDLGSRWWSSPGSRARRRAPAPAEPPWRPAHATAAPCPTSRPRPRRPPPRRDRRRSRRSRPSCREPQHSVVLGSRSASAPKMMACGESRLEASLQPVAQRQHAGALRGKTAGAAAAAAPKAGDRRPHSRCRRARRAPGRRRVMSGSRWTASSRLDQRADALGRRRSCARKGSEDRRRAH